MFKFVNEVKYLIDRYYSHWQKHLSPEMMNDILISTSFLDYKNPSVKERVFYYIFEKKQEDICPECGNFLKFHGKLTPRKNTYCSKRCANIANVDKITKSRKKNDNSLIQEKRRKTCLEKYGVDHVWKDADVRKKCRETCFERHGYDINFRNKEFIKKSLEKRRSKYGEKLEKIHEKRLKTIRARDYDIIKNKFRTQAKLELLDTKEDFINKESDFSFKCLMCR